MTENFEDNPEFSAVGWFKNKYCWCYSHILFRYSGELLTTYVFLNYFDG